MSISSLWQLEDKFKLVAEGIKSATSSLSCCEGLVPLDTSFEYSEPRDVFDHDPSSAVRYDSHSPMEEDIAE
jgi:hypothetical protein